MEVLRGNVRYLKELPYQPKLKKIIPHYVSLNNTYTVLNFRIRIFGLNFKYYEDVPVLQVDTDISPREFINRIRQNNGDENLFDNGNVDEIVDEIIKKLPNNIFLISAGYCPLLDDSIRFVNKLKQNNMKVDHFIFDLPHGFLNFNHIIPSVNKIINQCSDYINFVLSQ